MYQIGLMLGVGVSVIFFLLVYGIYVRLGMVLEATRSLASVRPGAPTQETVATPAGEHPQTPAAEEAFPVTGRVVFWCLLVAAFIGVLIWASSNATTTLY